MQKTCYFCGQPKTSLEHAPPKCIFPAQKDANNKDHRKNLIKVPSCDIHNTEKSEDDEYLMMVLALYFQNNQVASNQIKTKITRAWKKTPNKAIKLLKNFRSVDIDGKKLFTFELDTHRFQQCLELTAHALYFHNYGIRIIEPYKLISAPMFEINVDEVPLEVNKARISVLKMASELFQDAPRLGENQEVFWYQLTPELDGRYVVRMCFYEAFPVVLMASSSLNS